MLKMTKISLVLFCFVTICVLGGDSMVRRSYSDQSVRRYLTERTCSWNEICKEEFRKIFRCKCPQHYFCRSAGKYYNAYCSMEFTGYIWAQDSALDWDIRG